MKCFAFFVPLLAAALAEPGAPGLLARGAVGAGYAAGAGYAGSALGQRGALVRGHAVGPAYGGAGYAGVGYAGVGYAGAGYAGAGYAGHGYAAPAPAPKVVSNQYHKQDELANFEYGYNNVNSAKRERGNGYGGVTGSYSYVDPYGIKQRVDYVADDYGFRVSGSNIHNTAATLGLNGGYGRHRREASGYGYGTYALGYGTGLPAPVQAAREGQVGYPTAGIVGGYGYGAGYGHGYGNPVRSATLQTVKLNPGHAVAYRVY